MLKNLEKSLAACSETSNENIEEIRRETHNWIILWVCVLVFQVFQHKFQSILRTLSNFCSSHRREAKIAWPRFCRKVYLARSRVRRRAHGSRLRLDSGTFLHPEPCVEFRLCEHWASEAVPLSPKAVLRREQNDNLLETFARSSMPSERRK